MVTDPAYCGTEITMPKYSYRTWPEAFQRNLMQQQDRSRPHDDHTTTIAA